MYSKIPRCLRRGGSLEYFVLQYGLNYRVEGDYVAYSVTGTKDNYFSVNKRAGAIGYRPQFTSLDCISMETKHILKSKK